MEELTEAFNAHAAKFFHGTLPLSSHGHSGLRTRLSWQDPRGTCALLRPTKQAPVRTDLTPRDKNDCLAVAQTLNVQVKRLAHKPNGVSL